VRSQWLCWIPCVRSRGGTGSCRGRRSAGRRPAGGDPLRRANTVRAVAPWRSAWLRSRLTVPAASPIVFGRAGKTATRAEERRSTPWRASRPGDLLSRRRASGPPASGRDGSRAPLALPSTGRAESRRRKSWSRARERRRGVRLRRDSAAAPTALHEDQPDGKRLGSGILGRSMKGLFERANERVRGGPRRGVSPMRGATADSRWPDSPRSPLAELPPGEWRPTCRHGSRAPSPQRPRWGRPRAPARWSRAPRARRPGPRLAGAARGRRATLA
jgi:hypothetical protein